MFLTSEEIAELCGKRGRFTQMQVLAALGISYKRRPDGSLIVLRTVGWKSHRAAHGG
jgi:Domain of unknown function (DUF4224)